LEAASVGGLLHGYIREVSAHTLADVEQNYISAASEPIFTERYRAMSLTLFRGSNQTKRTSMIILPVDRALSIYGALANRSEAKGARQRLSVHLMKMYIDGEEDEHRLTVEGLTYLHNLNQEIDSRN
jgi:hypothetical protein